LKSIDLAQFTEQILYHIVHNREGELMRVLSLFLLLTFSAQAFTEFYVTDKFHYIENITTPCDEKAQKTIHKLETYDKKAIITASVVGGLVAVGFSLLVVPTVLSGGVAVVIFGALPAGYMAGWGSYNAYKGFTWDRKRRAHLARIITNKEFLLSFENIVEESHNAFYERDLKKARKKYAKYISDRAQRGLPIDITFEEYIENNPLPIYTYKDRAKTDLDALAEFMEMELVEEYQYEDFRLVVEKLTMSGAFCLDKKRKILPKEKALKLIEQELVL
jgi:hypothetical protein